MKKTSSFTFYYYKKAYQKSNLYRITSENYITRNDQDEPSGVHGTNHTDHKSICRQSYRLAVGPDSDCSRCGFRLAAGSNAPAATFVMENATVSMVFFLLNLFCSDLSFVRIEETLMRSICNWNALLIKRSPK